MTIDIIGTGESSANYVKQGISIGVNDVWKIHKTNYLVCLDLPGSFSKERLRIILNSRPQKFFTQLDCWKPLMKSFEKIEFANGSGNLTNFNNLKTVSYSNNSPFVACVLAHRMGARQINLYGVDFNFHPNFKDENMIKKTLKDFKALSELLLSKGCKMAVTKDSKLAEIINVI